MQVRYFDHAGTTPLDPAVLEAMMPYLRESFGNPMSIYELGGRASAAVQEARADVAALINARPSGVIFTASGAESNNFALRGIALARQNEGKHIIVSKAEHHSVLNSARFLEKQGFIVTYLPIDGYGMVEPETLGKAITKETVLISIILASPEVGTIQPIRELAKMAKEKGIIFHTDAVAAAGQIPIDVKELGVDLLSLSAHQFYGPKGAAALYVREGLRIVPLIYGGIQEGGRRAGTENVPAIAGMGKAAAIARERLSHRIEYLRPLRDRLIEGVKKTDNVYLTGHPAERLPGHASFTVEFVEGEAMLLMMAAKGIYAASGSACSSKALKSSPVLLSMGIPSSVAQGSIVFSLGHENSTDDVEYAITEFSVIAKKLREISPYRGGWGGVEEAEKCIPKK
ncbi:MAG: cysteine desulfurase family protein [Thermodesulfovibrionales bacterium]|nr:cysteine desulfurase family protein [Thermodesulfovibrionales bacterium]